MASHSPLLDTSSPSLQLATQVGQQRYKGNFLEGFGEKSLFLKDQKSEPNKKKVFCSIPFA